MNKVKDLNTSFITMRNMALAAIFGLVIVVLGAGFMVYKTNAAAGRRVYVQTNGGTVAALAVEQDSHTPYEARNVVKSFMRSMFGHDQYTFKENIDAALPLIEDRGGRRIYEGFTRGQVLQNYERYAARSVLKIDSVQIDMSTRPYSGRVYTKQRIFIGSQQREPLPLAAKFKLVETERSDENPYGLLITDFDYIAYSPPISREEKQMLMQQEQDRLRALKETQGNTALAPTKPAAPIQ